MFVGEFPPTCGGIGYYVFNLSLKLAEKGHDITIFTRQNDSGIKTEKYNNLTVIRVHCPKIYPFHVRFHYHTVKNYYNKFFSNYFDIAHFHSPLVNFFNTNIPSIVTEHGTVIGGIKNTPNHDFYSVLQQFCSPELIYLDKQVLQNVDIISCVSLSCLNEIKTDYGIKKEIFNVGNGVDPYFFSPANKKCFDYSYILYTGRLDGRKGLIDLINSAAFVVKKFPDVKFVLTGKGPHKNYLLKRISKLELENHFIFHNYVTTEKLLELYQNATLYVLPSYYEGLPTSLLEALSCGLPCIATDVAGNNELIIDGVNGILVPPHDPKKLAIAIENLLYNNDLRNKYSINGRKTIVENYSWDMIADKYIALYQKLLTHNSHNYT
jgi:L-malate glycosyltransferase